MRKFTFTASVVGFLALAYFLGYFALVRRGIAERVEIVNKAGSIPPKPGDLVEVTTVSRLPLYLCAPESLFWPVHYLDSRVLRPQYWADSRIEKAVRVNH